MPVVVRKVPEPPILIRDIAVTSCWDDLGPRVPVGTCVHRMDGTLTGTDRYFGGEGGNRCKETEAETGEMVGGLTDFGIGGQPEIDNQRPDLDGVIDRWNDPYGRRSPYANGNSAGPERNGTAFLAHYGVDSVNRDLVSIELSGFPNTPVTPKQFESLCWLVAHIHDAAGV